MCSPPGGRQRERRLVPRATNLQRLFPVTRSRGPKNAPARVGFGIPDCEGQDEALITLRGVGQPRLNPLLVSERLYLAGRDIRPVYKSSTVPGIQRDVRGNYIEGVGEI